MFWVESEVAEEFAGFGVEDADVEVFDDGDDRGSGVASSEAVWCICLARRSETRPVLSRSFKSDNHSDGGDGNGFKSRNAEVEFWPGLGTIGGPALTKGLRISHRWGRTRSSTLGTDVEPEYEVALRSGDRNTVERLIQLGHPAEFGMLFDPALVDLVVAEGADVRSRTVRGWPPTESLRPPALRRILAHGIGAEDFRKVTPDVEFLLRAQDQGELDDLAKAVSGRQLIREAARHKALRLLDDETCMTIGFGMLLVVWKRSGDTFRPIRWAEFDRELVSVDVDCANPTQVLVSARHTGTLVVDSADLSLRETRSAHPLGWVGDAVPTAMKLVSTPDGDYLGVRSIYDQARDAYWSEPSGLLVVRPTGVDLGDSPEFELLQGQSESDLAQIWVDPHPIRHPSRGPHRTIEPSARVSATQDGRWAVVLLARVESDHGDWDNVFFIGLDGNRDTHTHELGYVKSVAPLDSGIVAVGGERLIVCDAELGVVEERPLSGPAIAVDSIGSTVAVLTATGLVRIPV